MNPILLVVAYGLTIVASAVAGGYLPQLIQMNHLRMQILLSFVGGMMLGVSVLHLLPHGLLEIQAAMEVDGGDKLTTATSIATTMQAMLVGLLVTFFLMRAFHFHQHGDDHEPHRHDADQDDLHVHHHDHHEHDHDVAAAPHEVAVPRTGKRTTRLRWIGVMFGLGLHTFMDGVALGAAVQHESQQFGFVPAGFGVYLAILLHKPLDALSLSSLMSSERYAWRSVIAANATVGLMVLVGALGVLLWPPLAKGEILLGCLLAAAAGVFLCISLSDLLPEVQFHQHDRLQLSTALLLGIGIAFLIEKSHVHG